MLIKGVFVISFLPILMGDVRVECALPMQSLHERPPLRNQKRKGSNAKPFTD
jgi:hypothetical protein